MISCKLQYTMDPHSSSYHPLISSGFDPTIPSTHPSSPLHSFKRSHNHHQHRSSPQPRPLFNSDSDGQFPWQSYFSSDVTDKLVELVPAADSPHTAALDTSISTQCTAQRLQPVLDTTNRPKPKPKPKSKKKPKKKVTQTDEKEQTTKVFVEDKKPEETASCCWGCCAKSSDQYTKMTHEETPQKIDSVDAKTSDKTPQQTDHSPSPAIPRRKLPESVKKLEYIPQSPKLPDFRAYRQGNGQIHSPYIPPDVVFKIYEHPMKYNHPSRLPNQPQVPLLKQRMRKPKRSSGEESSYFSSTEWEGEDGKDVADQKMDTNDLEEEESSDPWSNHTQATTRKVMSSFKPELSKDTPSSRQKQTIESDESGKGPSDLSNEEKTPSNDSNQEKSSQLESKESTKHVVIRPLTEANVKSMDKHADDESYGEVVEKTEILSNDEQELSYKIYRQYRSSQHDDTDTTSGIANTFQSSHDHSELNTEELIPLQRLIKNGEPDSDVSFQFQNPDNQPSMTPITSPLSEGSMSTESILDQSGDEFGVLTESDFNATGQESDATFGTLSSYGSRKKSGWLSSKERLLEMHPVLKLCQEDEITNEMNNTPDNDTEDTLDFDNASSIASQDILNRNTEIGDLTCDTVNPNQTQQHDNELNFLPTDLPEPPDNFDTEDSFSSDGSLPPPPPPLIDDDGLTSEYSTLEMPVPMPLLHYSHLELTCAALNRLPDATPAAHLKHSFSNLSSPDSISKDSTVTMQSESILGGMVPEPALHSQRYYSSSMDSGSNISDASEGPQTVVCAMVHSPCQPTNTQEFDSDTLVKQLPSPDKSHRDMEKTDDVTDSPRNDQGKPTEKDNSQSSTSSPSQDNGTPSKTRHNKDKNCVLFDFDDKIVEEHAPMDMKPPRASAKLPKKSNNNNSNPTSPSKSRRSSNRPPKLDISEEKYRKHSRHKPQSPLNRTLLEFPVSRQSSKKDSDTTHSGSYGAGSYGYTDLSSGSTGNQPLRYAALPPMNIGKCIVKFGKKSDHSVQQPGHFSHPKAIDIFPNRDIAILDSENCTLQIFTEKGVCKKVYQFRAGIIDMIVWDSRTLALLKSGEISMFSLPQYEIDSLNLKNVQFPIALRKMTLPKQQPVFVVAMVTHVVMYTQHGDFLHTIPSHVDKGYGNLYIKRIGRIAVNPKTCDVIIADMDLRTIYIFSWEGDHKYTIDTKYFPIGPVANPQGIGLDNLGNILIADSFNHRVVQIFQGGVRVLLQYHVEYFPCAVAVTQDNRLVVAMDSEGRSFAGVRVYNYRHAIR